MTTAHARRDVAVCALGAQATLAQLVVLRAGLERFGGNEFFIGIALTVWLIAGAAGAAVFGKMADVPGRSRLLLRVGAGGVSIGVILSILVLRWLSVQLAAPGLAMSPVAAAAWMSLAAAPPAMMSGVLFAWLIPVVSDEFGHSLGVTTVLESAGAAMGGFVLGSLLIDWLGTPGLTAAVILCGGAATLVFSPPRATTWRIALAAAVVLVAAGGVWLAGIPAFRDAKVTGTIENRHGRFTAVLLDGQTTIMDGARTIVDCADTRTPELVATVVHAFAPDARDILVPAGAVPNLAVLSALPDRHVTLVTPNPELQAFTIEKCGARTAGRTTMASNDPIRALSTAGAGHDAILLDIGTPDTLNRSRLLNSNVFQLMRRDLAPGGTLFVMLGHADVHPTDAETRMLAGIMNSAASHFDDCRLLPIGNWWLVCGTIPEIPARVLANARTLPLERRWATDTFMADALDTFSLERLERRIRTARSETPASAALMPGIQFNALLDWTAKYHPSMASGKILPSRLVLWIVLAALPILLLLTAPTRLIRRPRPWAWTMAAVTGSAGIVVEIAMMWTFESAWGALHLWLGGMIAAYMAGLGVGAFVARDRFGNSTRQLERAARLSTLSMAVFLLAAVLMCIASVSGLTPAVGIPISLLVLAACAMASGASFQFAARRLWVERQTGGAGLTGRMRGVDSAVAGVAAILATLVFIPIAGTVAVLMSCALSCAALALHKSS